MILAGILGNLALAEGFVSRAVAFDGVAPGFLPGMDYPWISLFNGRDLRGWKPLSAAEDTWVAREGCITVTQRSSSSWLATKKQYRNFELQLQFFLPPDSDGGVFLRAPEQGNPAFQGIEIQLIDDDSRAFGRLGGWQKCGSLYSVAAAKSGAFTKAGQWQNLYVRAVGSELLVRLNGRPVIDVDLEKLRQTHPTVSGLARKEGHIGLQSWSNAAVKYRRIRLRQLP